MIRYVDYRMPEQAQQPSPSTLQEQSKQFYAGIGYPEYAGKYAPFTVPPGYEVAEVKEVAESAIPPSRQPQREGPPHEMPAHLEVTLKPKMETKPIQWFGPKIGYAPTKEELAAQRAAFLRGELQPSQQELEALWGLQLVTVVALPIAVPKLAIAAAAGVGTAEAVKMVTVGKHLTIEEAVGVAAISELAGLGAMAITHKYATPRVEAQLAKSYRQAAERGELWTPTTAQKIGMTLTGAQPPRLAPELVAAGEAPPVSFKMLSQKTLGAPEEAYFWDFPTPKTSQVYVASALGPKTKAWVGEHLIKRVSGGLSYALIQPELMQEVKALKPQMPYIPTEPYITEAADMRISPALGLLTLQAQAQMPQAIQRLIPKIATRAELVQEALLEQIATTAQTQALSQSQIQKQAQTQAQALVQTQKLQQQQLQKTVTAPFVPSRAFFEAPYYPGSQLGLGGFDVARLRRWGYYRRIRKVRPIATAEQVLEMFF